MAPSVIKKARQGALAERERFPIPGQPGRAGLRRRQRRRQRRKERDAIHQEPIMNQDVMR